MYIVFLAPETKNTQTLKQYGQVVALIKEFKNNCHDGTFPVNANDLENHAAQLTREIKKADALVVEASESNFNIGRFITLALQQHKPTLLLQKAPGENPLLIGTSRLVSIKQYQDIENDIRKHLELFFKIAKKQRLTYRFNIMLSKDINNYVMDKAQSQGMSKADYIRELIVHDMAD